MLILNKILKDELKDPEFASGYEEEKMLAELAVKIAKERERKGISQTELASRARLTQQQVSRLESDANSNVMTLIKVCSALNITLNIGKKRGPL